MLQLSGHDVIKMYAAALKLISEGVAVKEAHASIGVYEGTKLYNIMKNESTMNQIYNFPEALITLII